MISNLTGEDCLLRARTTPRELKPGQKVRLAAKFHNKRLGDLNRVTLALITDRNLWVQQDVSCFSRHGEHISRASSGKWNSS